MREVQTKVIDGCTYQVQMLPGGKGWKMGVRLVKMLGPTLAKAIGGVGGDLQKLLNSKLDSDFIAEVITMLSERLDETELDIIIQQLSACTVVDNKPLKDVFDLHFQGNPIGVVKWLAFAIQANFGPLSPGLPSASQNQGEQTK